MALNLSRYGDTSIVLRSLKPLNVTIQTPHFFFTPIEHRYIFDCCELYHTLKPPAEVVKKVNRWITCWLNGKSSVFVAFDNEGNFYGYMGLKRKKDSRHATLFGYGDSPYWDEHGAEAAKTIAVHYVDWMGKILHEPLDSIRAKARSELSKGILEEIGMERRLEGNGFSYYSYEVERKKDELEDVPL